MVIILKIFDEDETPMDILISGFPTQAEVIKEVMAVYGEYSEKYEVEFGYKLADGEEDIKSSGRTI